MARFVAVAAGVFSLALILGCNANSPESSSADLRHPPSPIEVAKKKRRGEQAAVSVALFEAKDLFQKSTLFAFDALEACEQHLVSNKASTYRKAAETAMDFRAVVSKLKQEAHNNSVRYAAKANYGNYAYEETVAIYDRTYQIGETMKVYLIAAEQALEACESRAGERYRLRKADLFISASDEAREHIKAIEEMQIAMKQVKPDELAARGR